MKYANMMIGVITPGPGVTVEAPSGSSTIQAVGATTAGAGAATIVIEVSNDGANWLTYDIISLTLSTTTASAGVEMDAPWAYVRGNVTAISGTGAHLSLIMGV